VGRDVIPPKDERAGIVTTSGGPGGWGEGSGEVKPRKASTAGLLREAGGSTNSSREQGPGGDRFRTLSPRGAGAAGNVRRAGTPRGAPLAHEENTLKGQAQERSGASASGGPVVKVAKGVAKPRTRHAAAEGSVASLADLPVWHVL
jgi:hypothetical protein